MSDEKLPEENTVLTEQDDAGAASLSADEGAAPDAVPEEAAAEEVVIDGQTPEFYADDIAADDVASDDVPAEAAGEEEVSVDLDAPDADATGDAGEEGEAVPPAPQYEDTGKRWFIIHSYSGFEQKVADSLRSRSEAFGFAEKVGQILIPTEEVVELRNGKKVTSKRLLYPGYVLVELDMDDELWHAVKATPRVTGFVGGGGAPVPLTADEVNGILYRQATSAERPRPKLSFERNEEVRIIDGPFTNFSGKVDEVNGDRNTLRVMVTIFGRSTPVELDFLQVEKTV